MVERNAGGGIDAQGREAWRGWRAADFVIGANKREVTAVILILSILQPPVRHPERSEGPLGFEEMASPALRGPSRFALRMTLGASALDISPGLQGSNSRYI